MLILVVQRKLVWRMYGKIQEGRNLVKRAVVSGLEPSSLVINEIARGYCEKKDFDDLLSFFAEMKCAPTVIVAIQAQKGQTCFCENWKIWVSILMK